MLENFSTNSKFNKSKSNFFSVNKFCIIFRFALGLVLVVRSTMHFFSKSHKGSSLTKVANRGRELSHKCLVAFLIRLLN